MHLVLGDGECRRPGADDRSGVDQGGEHVLRYVLMVERDDVDIARKGEHRADVAVVADRGGREGRRAALRLGQHADLDAERDRGRHHHAGELPSAENPDPHLSSEGSPVVERLDFRPVRP